MKWVGLIAAALVLALACTSSPPGPWQRVDGSPVIPDELARDEETCRASRGGMPSQGAKQRARDMKLAHEECMTERGWVRVPVEPE